MALEVDNLERLVPVPFRRTDRVRLLREGLVIHAMTLAWRRGA